MLYGKTIKKLKNQDGLIKGTIILTIAGFITRLIGFFYRIFLSNRMGTENLGIYQLIFPIYGISFAIYAVGIQTSISRLVASALATNNLKEAKKVLKIGLILSFSLALLLSIIIYKNSDYIAWRFLLEKRSGTSIRILTFVFPFCSITSCINGYYYGFKKATVPATTQLLEQVTRVVSVYIIALIIGRNNQALTCELGVLGIILGEFFSSAYNCVSLFFLKPTYSKYNSTTNHRTSHKKILNELLKSSIPLSSNRLLINILSSIEAVLIPSMLKKFGLSTKEALTIFGVLNGMSIPFILFPSTIANSFAVMLLPIISEARASYNNKLISRSTSISMKYSILIGILSTAIFMVFGKELGLVVFNNKLAGKFLMCLSWLCPFIYLTTTLSSIINGLGKTHITFINSLIGVTIRILFTIILVPIKGIEGYLIGLLISQLIISFLDIYTIIKHIKIQYNAYNWVLKPSLFVFIESITILALYNYLYNITNIPRLILLLLSIALISVIYLVLLFLSKVISLKELKS